MNSTASSRTCNEEGASSVIPLRFGDHCARILAGRVKVPPDSSFMPEIALKPIELVLGTPMASARPSTGFPERLRTVTLRLRSTSRLFFWRVTRLEP